MQRLQITLLIYLTPEFPAYSILFPILFNIFGFDFILFIIFAISHNSCQWKGWSFKRKIKFSVDKKIVTLLYFYEMKAVMGSERRINVWQISLPCLSVWNILGRQSWFKTLKFHGSYSLQNYLSAFPSETIIRLPRTGFIGWSLLQHSIFQMKNVFCRTIKMIIFFPNMPLEAAFATEDNSIHKLYCANRYLSRLYQETEFILLGVL